MWVMTNDPLTAPGEPEKFTIEFTKGIPTKLSLASGEEITDSLELYMKLNQIGKIHGIGRVDIVENRFSKTS